MIDISEFYVEGMVAEQLADKVLKYHFDDKELSFPINPFDIINRFGVIYQFMEFEKLEGIYFIPEDENDIPIIGINFNRNIQRQRYTAAHELCHHIKDQDSKICPIRGQKNEVEKYADKFASALLMPKNELRMQANKYAKSGKVDLIGALKISTYFGTSLEATVYALAYRLKLTEKRVVTYNPKLAEKQRYEINKQVEKAKLLKACEAKKAEYGDSAKYVSFVTTDKKGAKTEGKIKAELNDKAIEKARELAGYNMMVTSEVKMSANEIYAAYHNLWRIEESFKIMKTQLDARPVYLQKEDTIIGHFLICYLSVLLTRLVQIYVLNDNYGTEEIFDFIRDFKVAKVSDRKYINLTRNSSFIRDFSAQTNLPLTSYFLGSEDINKVLSHRF